MPRTRLRRYFRHGLLPQLMVFEAVARRGGVTRAAEELHLAQSTVSTQLAKLSEALGAKLHELDGRGLRLTAAGRELQDACGELLALLERVESRLDALRTPREEVLRLAAAPSARRLAARLLAAFCSRHPGTRVSLHVATQDELIESVLSGRHDLSLLSAFREHRGLASRPVARERLRLYTAAQSRLVRTSPLTLGALGAEPLVLREPGSRSRGALLDAYAACGVRPHVQAELASDEAIAHALAAGVGIGLLPDSEAEPLVLADAITPIEVSDLTLEREWSVVHSVSRPLRPVAALFLAEAADGGMPSQGKSSQPDPGAREAISA